MELHVLEHLKSLRLNAVQWGWLTILLFAIICCNTPRFIIENYGLRSLLFFIGLLVILFCLFNLLFTPFFFLPYLSKSLLTLLIIISTSCSYVILHYYITVDRNIIQNNFEMYQADMNWYFTISLALTILLRDELSASMVTIASKKLGRPLKTMFAWIVKVLMSLIVLAVICVVFHKDYASFFAPYRELPSQDLPVTLVSNIDGYYNREFNVNAQPLQAIGEDVSRPLVGKRPKLIIYCRNRGDCKSR